MYIPTSYQKYFVYKVNSTIMNSNKGFKRTCKKSHIYVYIRGIDKIVYKILKSMINISQAIQSGMDYRKTRYYFISKGGIGGFYNGLNDEIIVK